jgi:hypothetical protein
LNLLDTTLQIGGYENNELLNNLNTVEDYSTIVTQALFIDSKFKFDFIHLKENYLVANQSKYYLGTKSIGVANIKTNIIDTNFFNKLNFTNQRLFESVLNKNVNFSKQQR